MSWGDRYRGLEARRTAVSLTALEPVRTVTDRSAVLSAFKPNRVLAVGNAWSKAAFDGPWLESRGEGPTVGVVFVRSRDGNTATRHPAALGGGAVDEHLINEGLSRVAADAVVAGAATLHPDALFTVWHPELIALRGALGLPRHPAQIVMAATGSVDPGRLLLFNLPDVPVYVLTSSNGRDRLASSLATRPHVRPIVGASLREQFDALAPEGLRRVCSVGGRRSATALVDAGLVQDVYLTTTAISGGEPDTPWYTGTREPAMSLVLAKEWDGPRGLVRFEHLVLSRDGQA
jgi:riboflavin biosynthesis pyrimidine reductase